MTGPRTAPPGRAARLHLVRHGEVENPSGVIYGALPGFGLSERGRGQVRALARYLESILQRPATIVSSPLERAKETATILRDALALGSPTEGGLALDERLVEAGSGLDGLPRRFAPTKYLERWFDGEARARREAPSTVADRMHEAVRAALATHAGEVIAVSHQFPIHMAKVAITRARDQPSASLFVRRAPWLFVRGRCSLASVTTLTISPEGIVDVSYWEP